MKRPVKVGSKKRRTFKGVTYRSIFEADTARNLSRRKIPFTWESSEVRYVLEKIYVPDFEVDNILIETKGHLSSDDRRKMLAVKKQNPDLDIRFVFQNANNKIRKGSKTTYAMWAENNNFIWANKRIPKKWLEVNS